MKNILKIISLYGIALFWTCNSYADPYKIKLAIFDNIQPDLLRPENSQELKIAYLSGINTAIQSALKNGVYIEKREFFHNNSLLNIIQTASEVNTWKPDIIMGFHTSNDFLMAKTFFSDKLILSISATDPEVSTLPNNFYSLGIPDTIAKDAMIKFISAHYPNANLFITVGAESKECMDFSHIIVKSYKESHPKQRVLERKFLTGEMDTLNLSKFMDGYQPGDIIIVMATGYNSGIELMNKITAYLNPVKPIFISPSDNWGNQSVPRPIKGLYDLFRIDYLAVRKNSNEYKEFAKNFIKIYNTQPTNSISFMTYRTAMSFVKAIKIYSPPTNVTTTKAVLWSYRRALKHDPDWFRSKQYITYKIEDQKEIYFETLTKFHN